MLIVIAMSVLSDTCPEPVEGRRSPAKWGDCHTTLPAFDKLLSQRNKSLVYFYYRIFRENWSNIQPHFLI